MTADATLPSDHPVTYSRVTKVALRPRYEHAGAGYRLGVRGLTSLAEETLVNWFRVRKISPSVISERFGYEFSIADCSSLCSGVVTLDDELVGSAQPVGPRYFDVRLTVGEGETERTPLRSRVTIVLVRRPGQFEEPPEELHGMLVDGLEQVRAAVPGHDPNFEARDLAERMANGTLGWHRSVRVPMDGCHHSGRIQHATHLRIATELAEEFAQDHGLPARRLLEEQGLVAIMPRVRVRLLADALAGELMHVRYEVHQVVGGNLLDCRFDAHVERDGLHVPVAFGILLQGFARADDPSGAPAPLSEEMIERLTAERAAFAG